MESFGSRLKAARRARHLAQETVARAAGISLSHYRTLEHDRAQPRLETAVRLAIALGVGVETLSPEYAQIPGDKSSYPHDYDPYGRAS